MSETENVFRRRELQDIYISGEVNPLTDLYLLEDVALTIKELEGKIDFYKDYKKKKSQDVTNEIKVIENKVDFYKLIMVSTLEKNNEKSVKFPGSCTISARNQKSKWVVNDEEEFLSVLQAAQKAGENVDDVLEKVVQYNVRKKEASKLLAMWEQNGKLDGFLKNVKSGATDVVIKEPQKTTVSIRFLDEEKDSNIDENVDAVEVPIKAPKSSNKKDDDYDGI